ncbi:MAG: rhomboid family intramembrane serine protease [Anaerolineae bacterium]|nr:rhomboid family intramembrane serine protease [Anaerolineae bacterium]MCI0611244.1 rhomboid family intramembrane serine protease [Anaerolineae bacterium]
MIPLYDTIRPRRFPFINWLLILANAAVFWYELQLGEAALRDFIFTWGLIPGELMSNLQEEWLTVFTSMFLHGGWFHIISNMWVLYIFGDNIEERLGSTRYLLFYLLSGIAAAALQVFIMQGNSVPMIGASGAIAGVLGAYLISFPGSRIASLVPIFFIFTIVEIPAIIFLVFWFISQLYSGLFAMQGGSSSGIAWWAHIGGFIFGLIMVSFFRRRTAYRSY